jgi:hypothetical protein
MQYRFAPTGDLKLNLVWWIFGLIWLTLAAIDCLRLLVRLNRLPFCTALTDRYKHVCLKCNGMHPSILCNTFKNSHVNRSVRAVQNGNLFNRTSSLRQPMAANVNQIRQNSPNAPLAIKRNQRLTSICDHDLIGFCAILNLICLS